MAKPLHYSLLPVIVFLTGASVLIVEVVAVRVLSPYFGNTIYTVSSVLSVILLALSIGYWLGGTLADRHPRLEWFFGLVLVSGPLLLLSYILGKLTLGSLSVVLPITSGPLISAGLLFIVPAIVLGTLSPYAVTIQSKSFSTKGIGVISGQIFFWSTLGSIVGSLLTGFVFIPRFGVDKILIVNGVFLFLLGLIPLLILHSGIKKKLLQFVLINFVFVFGFAALIFSLSKDGIAYSKDGVYEKLSIYDGKYNGRPTRFFEQDRSSSGAMFLDSKDPLDLVYDYTKYYALYKLFTPDVDDVLIIGGGAYSLPKAFLAELPDAQIDVAEIEPSLDELSEKYFYLPESENLHTYSGDGRKMLRDSDKRYDVIFGDAYYSLFSVPAHLTTTEFFEIVKSRLNPEGVFIVNMIGDLSRQEPSLIMAEIKTFQSVFKNSYFFAVESPGKTGAQNIIIVGYNSDHIIDVHSDEVQGHENSLIRTLKDSVIDMNRFDLTPYPILTDNFSPVEYLSSQVLKRTVDTRVFNGDEMLALINQQLRYGPRHITALGHREVQDFIIAELKTLTSDIVLQEWKESGKDSTTYELKNIIARISPENPTRIVLGTHYDSKRYAVEELFNKDLPVPGANDGASGVAVLLEVARKLAELGNLSKVGIDIVFFDGEEGDENLQDFRTEWKPIGSTYFSEHLESLYGDTLPTSAVVIDMVCDKDLKIKKEQTSLQGAETVVEQFWDVGEEVDSDVFVDEIGNAIADDHTPLARAGIPSILVIDFEYPSFHTTKDTLDKCSAKSLETVAQAVFNYTQSL